MVTTEITKDSVFQVLKITLQPGEQFLSEAGGIASYQAGLELKAKLRGGIITSLIRWLLGGESLFISVLSNPSDHEVKAIITSPCPGEIYEYKLSQTSWLSLEKGTFLACDSNVNFSVRFAGFSQFFAREGLFKLVVKGEGRVWFSGYGAIQERQIEESYIIDSGHLIAFEEGLKPKIQLASGVVGSFFSGEGLVTRLEGRGKAYIQTRSISALASWLNRFFY
jgi:uncharacterized protein (TIGR00266 family)